MEENSSTPLNSLLEQVKNNSQNDGGDNGEISSDLISKNTTVLNELTESIAGHNGLNFNLNQLTDEIVKLNFSLKKNAPVNSSNSIKQDSKHEKKQKKWKDEYTGGDRTVPHYRPTLVDKVKDFSPFEWAAKGTMFEEPLERMREKSKFKKAGGTGAGYEQQQRAAREFHKIHEHERQLRGMGLKKKEIYNYQETSVLGESNERLGDRKKNAKELLGSSFTGIAKEKLDSVSKIVSGENSDRITPENIVDELKGGSQKSSPLGIGNFNLTEEEAENYTVQRNILKTLKEIRVCICESCHVKKGIAGVGEGDGLSMDDIITSITGGAAGGTLAKSIATMLPKIIKGLGPIAIASIVAILLKAIDDSGWKPQWVKDLGKFFGVDEAGRKKAENQAIKGMSAAQQAAFEKEVADAIKAAGPGITDRRKENIRSSVYQKYAQQGVLPKKAPQGAAVDPANYNPVPGADEDRAFIEQIYKMEGTSDEKAQKAGYKSGYDVPLGYGKFGGGPDEKPLSELTMKEVRERQTQILNHPDNNKNSSAVGKPQIVRSTLFGKQNKKTGEWDDATSVAAELGLKDDDIFTPEVQDRITRHLAKRRGLDAYKRGEISEEEFQERLAPEWEAVKLKGLTPELRSAMEQSRNQSRNPDPNAATPIDPNAPLGGQGTLGQPSIAYDSLKSGRGIPKLPDNVKITGTAAQRGNMDNVDPALLEGILGAARNWKGRVEITSAYRKPGPDEKGNHSGRNAFDVQLYDENGKKISNFGNRPGEISNPQAYETFMMDAVAWGSQYDPKLTKDARFGGYFGDTRDDYMHIDRNIHKGMSQGTWQKGRKAGDTTGLAGRTWEEYRQERFGQQTPATVATPVPATPTAAAPTTTPVPTAAAASEPADPMAPGWEEQFAIDTAGFGTASASGGIDDSNTLTTQMMNTPATSSSDKATPINYKEMAHQEALKEGHSEGSVGYQESVESYLSSNDPTYDATKVAADPNNIFSTATPKTPQERKAQVENILKPFKTNIKYTDENSIQNALVDPYQNGRSFVEIADPTLSNKNTPLQAQWTGLHEAGHIVDRRAIMIRAKQKVKQDGFNPSDKEYDERLGKSFYEMKGSTLEAELRASEFAEAASNPEERGDIRKISAAAIRTYAQNELSKGNLQYDTVSPEELTALDLADDAEINNSFDKERLRNATTDYRKQEDDYLAKPLDENGKIEALTPADVLGYKDITTEHSKFVNTQLGHISINHTKGSSEARPVGIDLDTELAKAEFEEKSNNWKYDDAQRAKKELAKSQAASKPVGIDLDTELAKAEFEEKSNNWKYDDSKRAKKELDKVQALSKPVEEKAEPISDATKAAAEWKLPDSDKKAEPVKTEESKPEPDKKVEPKKTKPVKKKSSRKKPVKKKPPVSQSLSSRLDDDENQAMNAAMQQAMDGPAGKAVPFSSSDSSKSDRSYDHESYAMELSNQGGSRGSSDVVGQVAGQLNNAVQSAVDGVGNLLGNLLPSNQSLSSRLDADENQAMNAAMQQAMDGPAGKPVPFSADSARPLPPQPISGKQVYNQSSDVAQKNFAQSKPQQQVTVNNLGNGKRTDRGVNNGGHNTGGGGNKSATGGNSPWQNQAMIRYGLGNFAT